MSGNLRILGAGITFAILWASASIATKTGLAVAQPFVIAVARFFTAAVVMLVISHIMLRKRVPVSKEWKHLMVYGLLNVSIYLGLYVIALQYVSAGIATLSIASNPVYISIISSLWFKRPLKKVAVVSLLICTGGILIAAYPLLETSYVTPFGLTVLLLSMLSYSIGALYFSNTKWNDLTILTINGWQTLFGGIFLLPFLFYFYDDSSNTYNYQFTASVLWLAIPVSIGALQLWMLLLRDDPVKASFWLFLCPVFGFIMAAVFLGEPISGYTFAGVALVLAGLALVQRDNKRSAE